MPNNEHVLALIEPTSNADSAVQLARDTVERGGRATVVILLSAHDWRGIQQYADAEDLSIGDAEAIYIDRVHGAYRSRLGASVDTMTAFQPRPKDVMSAATKARATSVALPHSIASRRQWRSHLKRTNLPVVITPNKVA